MTKTSVKPTRIAWSPKAISEATGLSLPFVTALLERNHCTRRDGSFKPNPKDPNGTS